MSFMFARRLAILLAVIYMAVKKVHNVRKKEKSEDYKNGYLEGQAGETPWE